MAKATINFKSIEIPAVVQSPLYAGVGASDLAVTAVKEYVADVQKKITGFDAGKVRANALEQAKARRAAVESRVADLQGEALAIPTKVQKVVDENVATVAGTYSDLAKRGEAVVRGTKLPSSAKLEVKVNPTRPAAKTGPVRKPAIATTSTTRTTVKPAGKTTSTKTTKTTATATVTKPAATKARAAKKTPAAKKAPASKKA